MYFSLLQDGSNHETQHTYIYNIEAQREEAKQRKKRSQKNERRQEELLERLNILQEKRQEERRLAEDLLPKQREIEQEEGRRREEEEKRLRLEYELCPLRAKLIGYEFGKYNGLHSFQGLEIDDVTQLRIGLFGTTGAGISCFINGCERVLRQTERGTAPYGGNGWQVTSTVQDYLPEMFFHLVDTPGFFGFGRSVLEFQSIVEGRIQPGSRVFFSGGPQELDELINDLPPCPGFAYKLHGIIFFVHANDPRLRDGVHSKELLPFREIMSRACMFVLLFYAK